MASKSTMRTARTTPDTETAKEIWSGIRKPVPGLLLAWAHPGTATIDRCQISGTLSVGRGKEADVRLRDERLSRVHFIVTQNEKETNIRDNDSTNGTFLNGSRLESTTALQNGSVIRAGRAVFVYMEDAVHFLEPPPAERFDMAGSFHTGHIIRRLNETVASERHIMLAGPTGSGKELAAKAVSEMYARKHSRKSAIVTHNAARYSSEEEAASSIFGIQSKSFSGVAARPGLIEQAEGGVLFLDEIHNLPLRVQRTLLRFVEDGVLTRIGATSSRKIELLLVLATNIDINSEQAHQMIANDLLGRLRIENIPSIDERIADVPAIFNHIIEQRTQSAGLAPDIFKDTLSSDCYEAMCLNSHNGYGIRDLVDLADRLITKVVTGTDPASAVSETFSERFSGRWTKEPLEQIKNGTGEPSSYEENRHTIIALYRECGGNLSELEKQLKSQGISCSRRWLAEYLDKWGERKARRSKKG